MRDPIENVTRLQKQLNNLQLENQVLKNILDKAGLSYQNELASIRKKDTKPQRGSRRKTTKWIPAGAFMLVRRYNL